MNRLRDRRRTWFAVLLALSAPASPLASAERTMAVSNRPLAEHIGKSRMDYAERPVREFLTLHFAGTRKFSATGLDKKERLFTRRFRQGLYKFFERVREEGRVVPLVMDPFTGSQGATTFSVGDAKVRSEKAWVPVSFSDGTNDWTITYLLRNDQERNDDRWRIDDIQDVRGMLLTEALKR